MPRIAIIGAGPIGIDATLAAIERGFAVRLFEASEAVGGHIQRWQHVKLFTPWELDLSSRMRRALGRLGIEPASDHCPTGNELLSSALEPLAAGTAVGDVLHFGTKVVSIGRKGLLKHEEIGTSERASRPFRLLTRSTEGERLFDADVVLDCSGLCCPNALGDAGMPALGENENTGRICSDIPRLPVDSKPGKWSEGTTMIVGAGHSAETAVRDIAAALVAAEAESGQSCPGKVIWVVRAEALRGADADDPLPERRALTSAAFELTRKRPDKVDRVQLVTGAIVERVVSNGNELGVTIGPSFPGAADHRTIAVSRLVALTGKTGDHTLYRQLQVHQCYATEGPMKLAAALLSSESPGDCLDQTSHGADTLANPEPGFFILGSKSYGRRSDFLLRVGYEQVDEIFELLAPLEGKDAEESVRR